MKLAYDAFRKLRLTLPDGRAFDDVTPVRCFPFSHPDGEIAFLDPAGGEVNFLDSLDSLSAEQREFLEADLRARALLPRITRVMSVSTGAEPTIWCVITDAGPRTFSLASEDHIQRLGDGALVTDAAGVRYRIESVTALDRRSRTALNRYL